MKEDYPKEIEKLNESLPNYRSEIDFEILKTRFLDRWEYLIKKLANPFEIFKSLDDYQKPVDILKKEDFFSKLKIHYPSDEEIDRSKESFEKIKINKGEELTEIYLKIDILLLICVFEKFIRVSVNEFGFSPLYCVSLTPYTWQCGLKYTGINLQTLQDKDKTFLLENNIRGGISSIMGDRYIKSDENIKMLCIDNNNLYGWAMSEYLPYDEIKFDKNVKLEKILTTPDDTAVGYFMEFALEYPDKKNIKQKIFHLLLKTKKNNPDIFSDYMKEIIPDTYTQNKKLICDWSDKKIFFGLL